MNFSRLLSENGFSPLDAQGIKGFHIDLLMPSSAEVEIYEFMHSSSGFLVNIS